MSTDFRKEKAILDELYSEMVEAIMNKPKNQEYEISRIYFENVSARMNHWVAQVKEVKDNLEKREPINDLSADNRPA